MFAYLLTNVHKSGRSMRGMSGWMNGRFSAYTRKAMYNDIVKHLDITHEYSI